MEHWKGAEHTKGTSMGGTNSPRDQLIERGQKEVLSSQV